jgi:flagellar biosynthesis protein FliQ
MVSSNPILIFAFLCLYGISLFGYILLIQSLFFNPKIASIVGTLIYFGTGFLDLLVRENYASEYSKNMFSLFSTVAVSRGAANLAHFESAGIGLHWSNLNELYHNYRFSVCFVMMIVSGILLSLVGLYLDNVIPGPYGQR